MEGLLEKQESTTSAPLDYDKEEMDIFVANGIKMIHTRSVSDSVIQRIVASPNPIMAIVEAVLQIIARLEQSAASAGKKIALPTLAFGGNILMGEIINLAEKAGMKKLTDEEKYKAFSTAIARYLDEALKSGKVTKEEIMSLGKELQNTPEGMKIAQTAKTMPPSAEALPTEEV